MFCAFRVKQYDAAVVKVKGYRNSRIVLYAMPVFRILVDVLEDYDRVIVAFLKQAMVVSFYGHNGHINLQSLIYDIRCLAACFQIIMKAHPINNCAGLSVVSQTEIEESQLTSKPAIPLP